MQGDLSPFLCHHLRRNLAGSLLLGGSHSYQLRLCVCVCDRILMKTQTQPHATAFTVNVTQYFASRLFWLRPVSGCAERVDPKQINLFLLCKLGV